MDNYFILSSKDGDKWAKVAPNMTSVKLGTCIQCTYSLDLVHFPIIQSSIQSFHDHSLTQLVVLRTFLSLYLNLYPYPYMFVYLVSLGAGLKKQVVRPVGY
jgi:hypothetical protein